MTQPDNTGTTGGTSFTQAQVDAIVRDRIARERAKFADYDDLKQAAEAAGKSKTQLDKMQEQLDKMEKRALAAEADSMRSSVAAELGLTPRQARRLSGNTRDELLADGRELLDDLGIKPGTKGQDGKKDDDKGTDDNGTNDADDEDDDTDKSKTPAPRTARTTESLRNGAPISRGTSEPEETDPMKLAAKIPRR
jgi:hypothetical protein